jgi:hypothetical protein
MGRCFSSCQNKRLCPSISRCIRVFYDSRFTFIYEATQVRVGKLTGTGEAITAGQKVYATLGSNFQLVTANPTGVIGTNYYFVGWAKKDAAAGDSYVLIRFYGHEYNHADRAA